MLTIAINSIEYNIPNRPEEMTLGRFLELLAFEEKKAPAKYKAWQKARNKEERERIVKTISDAEYQSDFFIFFAEWLNFLANIPTADLMRCDAVQVERLFNSLHNSYLAPEIKLLPKFVEHDGGKWYLPETLMKKSTLGEYVQAAQLSSLAEENKGNYLHALPKVLAILLRKEGESEYLPHYIERADQFKNVPMSIVWIVDFFLQRQANIWRKATEIYSSLTQMQKAIQS